MNTKLKSPQSNKIIFIISIALFALISVFGISIFTGKKQDSNIKNSSASATEPADYNNDNLVNGADLSLLLANWNTTNTNYDINKDGTVGPIDLSMMLTRWGSVVSTICTVDSKLVNSCRPWIGAAVGGYSMAGSNSATVQFDYFEKRLNDPEVLNNPTKAVTVTNKLDFIHVYKGRGDTLSSFDITYINRPSTYLQMNWKPVDGSWASGGGGDANVNADIDKTANSIKSVAPKKIMLSVFHEPENDITSNPVGGCNVSGGSRGTPSEYVQMWRNVRARFDALGVTNVVWNMNYMGFSNYDCVVSQLWPGNNYVDWVTYDPYVEGAATKYRNSAYTTKLFYNFLTSSSNATNDYLSKPWGFSEFGYWNQKGTSTETEAPKYWQEVKAAMLAGEYPKIKLFSVFDTNAAVGSTIYDSSSLVGLEFNNNNLAVPNINEQTAFNVFVNTLLHWGQ